MLVVGLMSGTSLDGVDASLVEITNDGKTFKEIDALSIPFSKDVRTKIFEASCKASSDVQKICSLNVELGHIYKDVVLKLLEKNHLKKEDIEFVAMHGQTIWHNPDNLDGYFSSTLQIGDPSIIAYHLNTMVISNFRMMDMAASGSGAPLVPFVNYILTKNDEKDIILQNIGGISNLTYIKRNAKLSDIIAFDSGPGNMLIDKAMEKLYNLPFDDGGKIALLGKVNEEVLNKLIAEDCYYERSYPKSTGREKYNEKYLNYILDLLKDEPKENIIATITALTSKTIIDAYKKLGSVDKIIISGGGAKNEFIIKQIKEAMNVEIEIPKMSDSFEAFAFGVLGYHTYIHAPSNVCAVTGAKEEVVLGNITYPPRKKEKVCL